MKKTLFLFGILAIVLVMTIAIVTHTEQDLPKIQEGNIKQFISQEEIQTFLKAHQSQGYTGFGMMESVRMTATGSPSPMMAKSADSSTGTSYSTTNIQVEGVDEADIIKSDGTYMYIVTGENVSIVQAYPAEDAKIISTINVNGYPSEIFINNDKLVIFGNEKYDYGVQDEGLPVRKMAAPGYMPIYRSQKSFIKVYDISDKENPVKSDITIYDGSYYDSRMIGNKIYVIVNQPMNYPMYDAQGETTEAVKLPEIVHNEEALSIMPKDIYYFDMYDSSYQLTTILALDLDALQIEKQSFLTGYAQNIYVSQNSLYLTAQKQIPYEQYQQMLFERVMIPLVDSLTQAKIKSAIDDTTLSIYERQDKVQGIFEAYYNALSQEEKDALSENMQERSQEIVTGIAKQTEKTIIHKISLENIKYEGRGEVPGHALNQFSMDEFDNTFRIATTTGEVWSGNSLNHLYVLDEQLNIIGKVEDLAKGEKIYSVRFMGKRAYVVTFKKVDPLFVFDLSNPQNPKAVGELKIPGYSDYLHPYDENHIIGIGKDAIDASEAEKSGRDLDFAWYQGIKLALFDVTDPANPKEVSKFNIGDRGTDSEALYEHKAFLFDKEKELLVIPISLHEIDREKYGTALNPTNYGDLTFEGVYVLSLNLENGFQLKGRVSHKAITQGEYRYNYGSQIRRSMYINNVLYTLSMGKLQANDLTSLEKISEVKLGEDILIGDVWA